MKYRELINSIGVGISIPKSISPSSLIGLEFASKLINKDGNLSPLPTLLLTRGRLIDKITFLSQVVERLLTEGSSEVPDLPTLFASVFGQKH